MHAFIIQTRYKITDWIGIEVGHSRSNKEKEITPIGLEECEWDNKEYFISQWIILLLIFIEFTILENPRYKK